MRDRARRLTYSFVISRLCLTFTTVFGVLSKLKNLAADAMKGASGHFSKASRAIADLAASLAGRAAAAADLGRILDIIEMVPGVSFEKPEPNADYLSTLLVAVQMGELTLAVHYRQQTEAGVVRLHPVTTAEANALTGSDDKFSSMILIDGENDKPAIQMLMNTEHLAENYRYVTADTLVNALAFPIENVKGGFIIARPFRSIARPIAGWLLNIIFDQGEKLHRRFRGNRAEGRPQSPSLSAEEAAGAASVSITPEDSDVQARVSDRAIDDQPRNDGVN
ncbi:MULTISPECIES: hypothetical protein [unclassified Bradyrhizobium]|uniref:hypothetical protein n=1 Tax=unclassified Bradyrhizobium TaxID=2631580 RepID=UPI0023025863|nr:hypothetical protein [Bradyrhizobium sp. CCBAU 45321]